MVTVSVVLSLVLIVTVQRLTKTLLLSMISGFGLFVVMNNVLRGALVELFLSSVRDRSFLTLIPAIFFIYFLGEIMDVSKDAQRMTESVQKLFQGSMGAVVFIPSAIGLMPMPAGAMFTAPMVDHMGEGMSKLDKLLTNYWFRHCLEFFWPVYPAMYLLAGLTSMKIGVISLKLSPLFFVSFLAGWVYLNGLRLPKFNKLTRSELKQLWPLVLIVSVGFMILLFKMEGWLALLFVSSFYALVRRSHVFMSVKRTLRRLDVVPIVLLVFMFKHAMMDFGLGERVSLELTNLGLSTKLVAILLPLLSGMSTGITHASLGISYPVVVGMGGEQLGLLVYVFSVLGVLLSPVHLCLILTLNYFKVDLSRAVLKMLPLIGITAFAAYLFYA
ncbi:MAG: DUF401 family protein [Pseudothermotoga sp.]|uniref:DUF401 family protein n=1 Tax=Pseudothermotoga sp. TaxID=2033661 RepID=UPI000A768E36|nr:DUF401 family protein [Pseudothermotoga sp.]HBT39651.1 hypothetical protein [Pseudothermotoga sp.]HCO98713.1 hypothetical protein [Pseudothermotoga sp.]